MARLEVTVSKEYALRVMSQRRDVYIGAYETTEREYREKKSGAMRPSELSMTLADFAETIAAYDMAIIAIKAMP